MNKVGMSMLIRGTASVRGAKKTALFTTSMNANVEINPRDAAFLREHYSESVIRLCSIIDRDVSSWDESAEYRGRPTRQIPGTIF